MVSHGNRGRGIPAGVRNAEKQPLQAALLMLVVSYSARGVLLVASAPVVDHRYVLSVAPIKSCVKRILPYSFIALDMRRSHCVLAVVRRVLVLAARFQPAPPAGD